MRGIGSGQTLMVYSIPEVNTLMDKELVNVPINVGDSANRRDLVRIVAWLVLNSMRTKRASKSRGISESP